MESAWEGILSVLSLDNSRQDLEDGNYDSFKARYTIFHRCNAKLSLKSLWAFWQGSNSFQDADVANI